MPAALMIGLDLGFLPSRQRRRRLLVARYGLVSSQLARKRRRRTVGSASASTTAPLSLAMMSFGVPFGTAYATAFHRALPALACRLRGWVKSSCT